MRQSFHFRSPVWLAAAAGCLLFAGMPAPARAQDTNLTITGSAGARKLNLAVADLITAPGDNAAATLQGAFNAVLDHDLLQSGRVNVLGKSLYPGPGPAAPANFTAEMAQAWTAPPAEAVRLVAGTMTAGNGTLVVKGYLYDLTQGGNPVSVAQTLVDKPTPAGARLLAHQFADAIVTALGGTAFATSKIVWFHAEGQNTGDVWMSDYDGFNPHQITHFGGYIDGPRLSPDGSRLSFSGQKVGENHHIHMVSMLTGQELAFPAYKGDTGPPSWSPDGKKLVFSSSMDGDGRYRIFTANADGSGVKRLTNDSAADDFSPVWNPVNGAQIAFCSDRGGQPHLYVMNADGGDQKALVSDGYVVDPAWSPNGLLLAFAWVRHGGGEDSGAFDIYLWDFTAPPGPQQYTQLTHNARDNDDPSWGPDSARLVFSSGEHTATKQLFTVLATGAEPVQLTQKGRNEYASWSGH